MRVGELEGVLDCVGVRVLVGDGEQTFLIA